MKPQPKTVRAWAFAWRNERGDGVSSNRRRCVARDLRKDFAQHGYAVGPVVRIEVPAPKERKR